MTSRLEREIARDTISYIHDDMRGDRDLARVRLALKEALAEIALLEERPERPARTWPDRIAACLLGGTVLMLAALVVVLAYALKSHAGLDLLPGESALHTLLGDWAAPSGPDTGFDSAGDGGLSPDP